METLASSPGLLILCGLALLVVALLVLVAIILGRRLVVDVGKIHAEVTPNGGSSMRDAVDRIEKTQIEHGNRLDRLEAAPPPPPVTLAVVNAPPPEAPRS